MNEFSNKCISEVVSIFVKNTQKNVLNASACVDVFFLKIDHNDNPKPRDGQSQRTVPIQIDQRDTKCGTGGVKTPVTDILMTGAR